MYNSHVMDIKALTKAMHQFVRDKGWYQPKTHRPQTPKNLAISLSIEAAEILEHFQWHAASPQPKQLEGELADVALYLLQLASVCNIDLEKAILEKLENNYFRTWDQSTKQDKDEHDNEN